MAYIPLYQDGIDLRKALYDSHILQFMYKVWKDAAYESKWAILKLYSLCLVETHEYNLFFFPTGLRT